MVQTGDPTGTGKGGTSIWGKKFEDEFHETLKVKMSYVRHPRVLGRHGVSPLPPHFSGFSLLSPLSTAQQQGGGVDGQPGT